MLTRPLSLRDDYQQPLHVMIAGMFEAVEFVAVAVVVVDVDAAQQQLVLAGC